ncbi:MFS transporter [Halodesulfovibrio marinisediminis]|uniref:Predicted arabinose efflux permease, MFS family n=1 Tax=Halodesulfovibrio marinisediminis DSM 17456 TaxID=1121457 RepID=A0A1N6I9W8_9BACT|nr:MFS transporter [Halodesulfovibrio marinisediminis]SIO28755.1 Predicted arabinose efflux permease, MFS family [Halodesulfovibrio marinisediminis DSM 17456]
MSRAIKKLFTASLILIACVQLFTLMLSSSTLRTELTRISLSSYKGIATQLEATIERGLRFGRPLDGFASMQSHLSKAKSMAGDIEALHITDPDGKVLYTTAPVTPTAFKDLEQNSLTDEWLKDGDSRLTIRPLYGYKNEKKGFLVVKIGTHGITQTVRDFLYTTGLISTVISFITAGLLFARLLFWKAQSHINPLADKKFRTTLFVFFSISQVAYGITTYHLFNQKLDISTNQKLLQVSDSLTYSLEYLLDKRINIAKLHGTTKELKELITKTPELIGASLSFIEGTPKSYGNVTGKNITIPISSGKFTNAVERKRHGTLKLYVNTAAQQKILTSVALNMGTTLVIGLLLLGELASLFAEKNTTTHPQTTTPDSISTLIRGLCFIFFFGFDMVLTFAPLAARNLNTATSGISNSLAGSLPISCEMAAAGLGIFLVGFLSDKYRWSSLFTTGVIFATAGCVFGGASTSIIPFIVARALAGLGFGIAIMAAQLSLVSLENKAQGMGNMFAGILAGSLCGSAAGAMLSDLFNYQMVFYTSAIFCAFALLLIKPAAKVSIETSCQTTSTESSLDTVLSLIKTPKMWSTLILAGLPIAISLSGFLYYFVPIFLNNQGINQADIGRLFMIYSLCIIYLGPVLGSKIDKSNKAFLYTTIAVILSGAALLIATAYPTLPGFSVSVAITGIAQCIAGSSVLLYVLALPGLQKNNKEKMASLFRLLERSGQIAGPLLFGVIATRKSSLQGVCLTGVTFIIAGSFFYFIANSKLLLKLLSKGKL